MLRSLLELTASAAALFALVVGVQAYRFGPKAPASYAFRLRGPSRKHG